MGTVNRTSGELNLAELYGLIRSQIEHENDLVSQRVLLNASKEAKNALFESEQTLLLWLMPTAALFAGLLTHIHR